MISLKEKKIVVTGATGFLGKHVMAQLDKSGYINVVGLGSKDYNFLEQSQVRQMFNDLKPDVVIHLAAYSGGILANKNYPADFCYRNLIINTEMIHQASINKVEKFLTVMGGCSYPGKASSPISEEELWNGYPQQESAPYSLAKAIASLQCKSYRKQYGLNAIVLVPGNIYGPYDNFSLENSHVIPGLIRKFYEATIRKEKQVMCWGSGRTVRDFVYVEDAAECLVYSLETYDNEKLVNISIGTGVSIKDLANTIAELTGFTGDIVWDTSKPDGQLVKVFDATRMKEVLKFECKTTLRDGLKKTLNWFSENYDKKTIRL